MNKFENWMNDVFAPWVVKIVIFANILPVWIVLTELASGGKFV